MANSSNAYAQARPLEGNVSDWITGQENAEFNQREEKRQVDAIAQRKKDKEQDDYEKRLEKFKQPDIKSTGVRSIDEINTLVLLKAKDQQLEIMKELKPGISNEKYAELTMRQRNLDNLPSYLKLSQDAFVKEADALKAQVAKGEIKFTPQLQQKLTSFSEGMYDVELDSNGLPMVGLWDRDGDGKPDIMPYDKIVSGQTFGDQVPDMDFTGAFQKMGKELGSVKTQTDKNFVKKTEKQTPIEFAKLTARGSLYDDKGGLTPLAKSKLYDMGVKDFTDVPQQTLDKLETTAVEIMMATRDKESLVDVDNSARNTAIKNARDAKKEDEKPTYGFSTPPPIYKEANLEPAKGYQAIVFSSTGKKKVSLPAIAGRNQKGEQMTITNPEILSMTVRKNADGQRYFVAQVASQDTKSTKKKTETFTGEDGSIENITYGEEKVVQVVTLTERDVKAILPQTNFKTVNELKDALRTNSREEEEKPTGTVKGGEIR